MSQQKLHGVWSNSWIFILAATGSAVGLGLGVCLAIPMVQLFARGTELVAGEAAWVSAETWLSSTAGEAAWVSAGTWLSSTAGDAAWVEGVTCSVAPCAFVLDVGAAGEVCEIPSI